MGKNELLIGFTEEENQIVTKHLNLLLPQLVPEKFIFVGGIAIRHHLAKADIEYKLHPFNDIDILIEDESAILPSVTKDFLIMHHHPAGHPWFFISLIDPVNKVKDHFFDFEMKPEKTEQVSFGKYKLMLVSPEDQLVKLVWDISRISENSKVEPKQITETKLMVKVANFDESSEIWKRKNFKNRPPSLTKALDYAVESSKNHPNWLNKKLYYKPKPFICKDCVKTDNFPVADMNKIYNVVGYGEYNS